MFYLSPLFAAILLICTAAFAQQKGTFTDPRDSKIPIVKNVDTSDGISRTDEEVEAVIKANMKSVELIYKEYLKQKLFSGDIQFIFAIAPSGEIIKIDILSTTTGNSIHETAKPTKPQKSANRFGLRKT